MQRYQCHKVVEAAEIVHRSLSLQTVTTDDGVTTEVSHSLITRLTNIEGRAYLVRYEDGYLSVSPADVFEAGYSPLDAQDVPAVRVA